MIVFRRPLAPALVILAVSAAAQRPPDIPLSAELNREVVEGTIGAISKYYVSSEVADRVVEGLSERIVNGEFDEIKSAFDLVDALDAHMQAISRDPHLALAYSHVSQPPVREIGEDIRPETPAERAESLAAAERSNFGFEACTRLPGNIGLLELNSFVRPEFSGEMAGNVMRFLASTDALIIDLRTSQGGSADMVTFLASYFFPGDESYHLCDWYTRVEGGIQQCWTYPFVPGPRYLEKDVFILTSRSTFSAPEGLTALLQHHEKAIVVGERTAGGTHPGVMVRVHQNFAVFVPVSMPVYPTGTPSSPLARPIYPERRPDEKGTGIVPDIELASEGALTAAHLSALEHIFEKHPEQRDGLQALIDDLRSKADH